MFVWAPRPRYIVEGGFVHAPPEATFDLARFNAIRAYQGQLGREVSRLLRELRNLREEPLPACTDEPEDRPSSSLPPYASSGMPAGPGSPEMEARPRSMGAPVEPGRDGERDAVASPADMANEPEAPVPAANTNAPNEPERPVASTLRTAFPGRLAGLGATMSALRPPPPIAARPGATPGPNEPGTPIRAAG